MKAKSTIQTALDTLALAGIIYLLLMVRQASL